MLLLLLLLIIIIIIIITSDTVHFTYPFPILRNFRSAAVIINPLNPELNPICHLLTLLVHHFLHVSRIRVKSLTLRLLMSYIYIYVTLVA